MRVLIISAYLIGGLVWAEPLTATAQAKPPVATAQAVKGNNTIIVRLPVGGDSAWAHVGHTLFRHHYAIRYSDRSLGTMVTDLSYRTRPILHLALSVLVTGSVVSLHAVVINAVGVTGHPDLAKTMVNMSGGGRHDVYMQAWQELDAFAHALGTQVSYTTQAQ